MTLWWRNWHGRRNAAGYKGEKDDRFNDCHGGVLVLGKEVRWGGCFSSTEESREWVGVWRAANDEVKCMATLLDHQGSEVPPGRVTICRMA